jgi:tetratricopeptide (TPR) repeat protein
MTTTIGSFGEWVRERRKQRGLTQKALGRFIGYAEITVRQIEHNTYHLTRFVVECIVNGLAGHHDDRDAIMRFALNQLMTHDGAAQRLQVKRSAIPFFGRETELGRIHSLFDNPDCRCISIVGVGGIGKTSLALRAIDKLTSKSTTDAYFVSLTDVSSSELMSRAIGDTLGIALTPFLSPSEQILQALQSRDLLLVLDNFEQLLPESANFVAATLERAPRIKMIITSRERLQISDEWSVRLEGLDTSDHPSMSDAVELFVSTAQRINDNFVPADINLIQDICRLVQGIPLAIEMAASWTELYPCSEILSSLSTHVLDLTARYRNIDDRHKTLFATFDTSWNRLSSFEQSALKRLAVFRGGFTLHAAQQVAGATPDVLAYLQDKTLIQPQRDNRLILHDMIRQLAFQKLAVNDDELLQACLLHAEYFVQLLTDRAARIKYQYTREEIARLLPEVENLVTAWDTLLQQRRIDWFFASWETLWFFFNITSRFSEGEKLFKSVLTEIDISTANDDEIRIRSHSQILCSLFIFRQGRIPEVSALLFAPEMARIRASTNATDQYWVHFADSYAYHAVGDASAALSSIEMVSKIVENAGNEPYYRTTVYHQLGRVKHLLGDKASAYNHLSEAVHICRQNHIIFGLSIVLPELGFVAETDQRLSEALDYYYSVLAATTLFEDLWNYQRTQISIGRVQMALGLVDSAIEMQISTLQAIIRNPVFGFHIDSFVEIALILKHYGEIQLAVVLLEYCAVHPECFQPTRNRAMNYLAAIKKETPNIDVSTVRNLLPSAKSDVADMLLSRLTSSKAI